MDILKSRVKSRKKEATELEVVASGEQGTGVERVELWTTGFHHAF